MTEKPDKKISAHQSNLNCDNVSQQIQVKNQKFKCIINLNTKVCTNESKHRNKCRRKHRSKHSEAGQEKKRANKNAEALKKEHCKKEATRKRGEHRKKEKHKIKSKLPDPNPSDLERIVPNCFRKACWVRHESRNEILRRNSVLLQFNIHKECYKRSSSKHEKPQKSKHRHHHHTKKIKQTEPRILLSPISPTPLDEIEDNLTYEDISSTSLESYVQPTAYKRHRKHCSRVRQRKGEIQESKLDTLIRRTKERERKLVEQSRLNHQPWFSSTPLLDEYSSADFNMSCSDMDISFNSLSTLVLESEHHNAYSTSSPIEDIKPTEDFQNQDEDINSSETEILGCRSYSPSSPTRDYTTETDYKLMNNKPMIDIEIYSPTSTPKMYCTRTVLEDGVKKEIAFKTEPLFSCEISPICFEDELDTGLEFCKIENVKSEFRDN